MVKQFPILFYILCATIREPFKVNSSVKQAKMHFTGKIPVKA